MILQYRACSTKHILLLFSGIFLSILQILPVEGMVTATSAEGDLYSTTTADTNNTSTNDFHNKITSTEEAKEALTDEATSKPSNGSLFPVSITVSEVPDRKALTDAATSKPNNGSLFPVSITVSEAHDRTISDSTIDKISNSSTREEKPTPKQDQETTGILIGCLVVGLFIFLIICLVFNLKNKKKKSYSLKYNKAPEEIPLNNVKA